MTSYKLKNENIYVLQGIPILATNRMAKDLYTLFNLFKLINEMQLLEVQELTITFILAISYSFIFHCKVEGVRK